MAYFIKSILAFNIFVFFCALAQAQNITSPEEFFGFQMGADKKLANWNKLTRL